MKRQSSSNLDDGGTCSRAETRERCPRRRSAGPASASALQARAPGNSAKRAQCYVRGGPRGGSLKWWKRQRWDCRPVTDRDGRFVPSTGETHGSRQSKLHAQHFWSWKWKSHQFLSSPWFHGYVLHRHASPSRMDSKILFKHNASIMREQQLVG